MCVLSREGKLAGCKWSVVEGSVKDGKEEEGGVPSWGCCDLSRIIRVPRLTISGFCCGDSRQ